MKKYTRYIDNVLFKGSINPVGLYTIDYNVDYLPPSKDHKDNLNGFESIK